MVVFGWLRRRRRGKLLAAPFPPDWDSRFEEFPLYAGLDAGERGRLHDILRRYFRQDPAERIRVSAARHSAGIRSDPGP